MPILRLGAPRRAPRELRRAGLVERREALRRQAGAHLGGDVAEAGRADVVGGAVGARDAEVGDGRALEVGVGDEEGGEEGGGWVGEDCWVEGGGGGSGGGSGVGGVDAGAGAGGAGAGAGRG